MFKWFLTTNLFVFACGVLQALGAMQYFKQGLIKFGILYFLYSLTNFVIWFCRGE